MFVSNLPYRNRKPKYMSVKKSMAVKEKATAPHPISLPCALALSLPSHRDATTPSPCWALHLMTHERIRKIMKTWLMILFVSKAQALRGLLSCGGLGPLIDDCACNGRCSPDRRHPTCPRVQEWFQKFPELCSSIKNKSFHIFQGEK